MLQLTIKYCYIIDKIIRKNVVTQNAPNQRNTNKLKNINSSQRLLFVKI